jgi:drug/metabolite transporter superfamily protein YnfA
MCNYLENKLLDHVLRNVPYTSPTTIYIALLTSNPAEAGDITSEVSGGSYARQAITFDEIVDGVTQNTYDIEFPQATADWGIITHVILMDAETGGNPLFYAELTTAKTITTDDIFKVPISELTVKLD